MIEIYAQIIELLQKRKETVSTMESCTGGSLAGTITNIEGASSVFSFGAVTYSNDFKIKLGVNSSVIEKYTVYSMETAREMAQAITHYTDSIYGIGITGKLGVEDPQNKGGFNHLVYIAIYDSQNQNYIEQTVSLEKEERFRSKEKIIYLIGNIFLKYLLKK